MILFFKAFFRELKLMLYARKVGYYTHIDFLPIYNWFEILKGNYEFLYKKQGKKECPDFFKELPLEMFFQFEKVEMHYFEQVQKLEYLRALYALTKKPDYLNQSRSLAKQLENESKINQKTPSLNEILNYIEETFKNIGAIDIHKMSTSRFFALYHRAIEKNKPHANTEA